MKTFDLDRNIIDQYGQFSQSFTKIKADDLRAEISRLYDEGRFWPEALLSLNPSYETGSTVKDLADSGVLCPETARIFRIGANPIKFHRHQEQAIAKACAGNSFVVTTGTGSGKSLCFFVPVVDAVIRARKAGQRPRTRAIVIYPMNALANSQINEINKFIDQSGLPEALKPVVQRYTGQESQRIRKSISDNPPDILLTNFMMAELLMTRQSEVDRQVISNAQGLDFIVLDELHTYRGRQGADVAVLVRRLRDRCTPNKVPIFIGTSATMANKGNEADKAIEVSRSASRLFGVNIGSDAVIDESLERATDDRLSLSDVRASLKDTIESVIPEVLRNADLRSHPLAVWAELALGLSDGQTLQRRQPTPIDKASKLLAEASGVESAQCAGALERFLTWVSLPENRRGGDGDQAFLAFKLHRFIAGAGDVFSTLRGRPRTVLLDGQVEDPNEPGTRLYTVRFCRECGQEHFVATKVKQGNGDLFLPRNIDDTPTESDDGTEVAGYLTPIGHGDPEYRFDGSIETLPEGWTEERPGTVKLRPNRKDRLPLKVMVGADGYTSPDGEVFWFIPGKFAFCPACLNEPQPQTRERSKLAGLTSEGRSSATTVLVSSALRWLNHSENAVPEDKRKLLGFTDNRQDAALQAGHFNDFLFVSLLRGAILRAVLDAGQGGLREDEFGLRVQQALGFTAQKQAARPYWMLDPDSGAGFRSEAERSLAKVLAHRVWTDLRRGWRFTNPNLSTLKLIDVSFVGLDEIAENPERLKTLMPELGALDFEQRRAAIGILLEAMLQGLAVDTEALDPTILDTVGQRSRKLLCVPWSIDGNESISGSTTLFPTAPGKQRTRLHDERLLIRAGPRSRIARALNRRDVIGVKLNGGDYLHFLQDLLALLADEGLLRKVPGESDTDGWKLSPLAVRLVPGEAAQSRQAVGNPYFHDLYFRVAEELAASGGSLFGLEGREHTAQVTPKQREWREWRFRYEDSDREQIAEHAAEMSENGESDRLLPALFCTPTMELGVDISALNTVYLRNVPPTPANYAQRAGRAGRSGQAAAIFTYCAAQSPHDQYYFKRRDEMVSGIVRPPTLDITNRNLVTSHLNAIWLAESGLALSANIPEILDLGEKDFPLTSEIRQAVNESTLIDRARIPMRRVLDAILSSMDDRKPPWMDDPDRYVSETVKQAPSEFDRSFDRWRELYGSALKQQREANERLQTPGLAALDRRRTKAAYNQAADQITILEQGRETSGSDFYSYRYLATEGFLPGYNFPRLPLYAFIPGEGRSGAYLKRARFLAISEFGPRSLIYHEGRAFRVVKAKLPSGIQDLDHQDLTTQDMHLCCKCGAAHDEEVELCHACKASMAGATPVKRTFRIDNVEAAPVERITANDEERIHQGFDIQTVFTWPQKHGRADIVEAAFQADDARLFTLQYANSAEISRINKGLRRRRDRTVLGFMIDPRTGYWARNEDEDAQKDLPPDSERPVRIVPIVRDRKNALLFRFENALRFEPRTTATVQHALLRGIAIEYQLEEGEILGEPLPDKDSRRAILAYEATEGGAGVLNRLMDDPNALNRVARRALELMHFDGIDGAVQAGDRYLLKDRQGDACVRGCYRCLLSYYNQPDHEAIDRGDPQALQLLIDLARGRIVPIAEAQASDGEDSWSDSFARHGTPEPDRKTLTLAGIQFPFAWRNHYVAAKPGSIPDAARSAADDRGWILFELPTDPSMGLPDRLIAALTG